MTVPQCHYCDHEGHTNDHVIPKSIGGPNRPWNIVPACHVCNGKKGDRTYEEFTGREELPESCVKAGFPTTASFRLFARQLKSCYGTDIRGPYSTSKSLVKKRLDKKRLPIVDEHHHPALVITCNHMGPCKGQDGCRIRRRDAV